MIIFLYHFFVYQTFILSKRWFISRIWIEYPFIILMLGWLYIIMLYVPSFSCWRRVVFWRWSAVVSWTTYIALMCCKNHTLWFAKLYEYGFLYIWTYFKANANLWKVNTKRVFRIRNNSCITKNVQAFMW